MAGPHRAAVASCVLHEMVVGAPALSCTKWPPLASRRTVALREGDGWRGVLFMYALDHVMYESRLGYASHGAGPTATQARPFGGNVGP